VLDRPDVDAESGFFALGGHSLGAVRMVGRLSRQLGIDLPLSLLFEHPKLGDFSAVVTELAGMAESQAIDPIVAQPRDGTPLPASWMQRRFWIQNSVSGPQPSFNLLRAINFPADADCDLLVDAVQLLVRRHEALRTRLAEVDGEIVQILVDAATAPIDEIELGALLPRERTAEFAAIVQDEAQRGVDLARDPLFRALVIVDGEAGACVVLCLHHAISDGQSLDVLEHDLRAIHAALRGGDEPALPRLALQFADFAARERCALDPEREQALLEFWVNAIGDTPQSLQIAPRERLLSGQSAARIPVRIDAAAAAAMRALAASQGCTLFTAALAVYAAVLAHLSGERNLLIGVPKGLRDDPAWEAVVGPFVNTLAVPFAVSREQSYAALVGQVHAILAEAYSHALLPFDRLVEHLKVPRSAHGNPLVQFAFGLHRGPFDPAQPLLPAAGSAQFHASLVLFEGEHGLGGVLEYDRSAVPDEVAAGLARQFEGTFSRAADRPDLAVRESLTDGSADGSLRGPSCPAVLELPELVAVHAGTRPDAIAVEAPDGVIDYARLDSWSNWLARRLRRRFGSGEVKVGVLAGNSRLHPVALLALLKAGLVYVPLDPGLPPDRLRQIADAAGIALVLTTSQNSVPDGIGEAWLLDDLTWRAAPPPRVQHDPDALAYILFTSGSTGLPKGVMITRKGMSNLVAALPAVLQLSPHDRWLKFARPSFDAAIFEMIAPLAAGATLCLEAEEHLMPGRGLCRILRDRQISATLLTPSSLALLPVEPLPELRLLCVAGEACPAELVRRWCSDRRMLNLYGPAEATILATWHECVDGEARPAIGQPIANLDCYSLDSNLDPVAGGGAGELFLSGSQVARGYHGVPALTAEAFLPDPFGPPGRRMYRTGDLARVRRDGAIEYLGRVDQQVKVRGARVEPGEVEALLLSHPSVAAAVVTKRDDASGGRLVAYVIGREPAVIDDVDLLSFLAERLPPFMMPSHIVRLKEFPRTPSGKVARTALPAPAEPIAARSPEADLGSVKARVCEICSDLLGREVTLRDNFFAIGGHSLLVIRLIARFEQEFGTEISARTVFDANDIDEICSELSKFASVADEIPRLNRKFGAV
jgi:amino acid adenylation domain-containing protein